MPANWPLAPNGDGLDDYAAWPKNWIQALGSARWQMPNLLSWGVYHGGYDSGQNTGEGEDTMTTKPCYFCGLAAPVTFEHRHVFGEWSYANQIIADFRSRFDGMRERLKWAAKDETEFGCHPLCALQWAIKEEGYAERYGIIPEGGDDGQAEDTE